VRTEHHGKDGEYRKWRDYSSGMIEGGDGLIGGAAIVTLIAVVVAAIGIAVAAWAIFA
jgi:hypothetical protein